MFKAILFDVYGTLLDVHSIQIVLEKYFPGKGSKLPNYWGQANQVCGFCLAPSGIPCKLYEPCRSLLVPLWLLVRIIKIYLLLISCPVIKSWIHFLGAVQVLDYIKSKNYKLAVLSNGDSEMLDGVFGNSGLQDKFDTSLSAVRSNHLKWSKGLQISLISSHVNQRVPSGFSELLGCYRCGLEWD